MTHDASSHRLRALNVNGIMDNMSIPLTLRFDGGTLLVTGPPALLDTLPHCQFDPRTGAHRAEGRSYRPVVEFLRSKQIPYTDEARQYQPTPWTLRDTRRPFPHQ